MGKLRARIEPHCRIGKIRFKTRSRSRHAQAFDLTTSKLIRAVSDALHAGGKR